MFAEEPKPGLLVHMWPIDMYVLCREIIFFEVNILEIYSSTKGKSHSLFFCNFFFCFKG